MPIGTALNRQQMQRLFGGDVQTARCAARFVSNCDLQCPASCLCIETSTDEFYCF